MCYNRRVCVCVSPPLCVYGFASACVQAATLLLLNRHLQRFTYEVKSIILRAESESSLGAGQLPAVLSGLQTFLAPGMVYACMVRVSDTATRVHADTGTSPSPGGGGGY